MEDDDDEGRRGTHGWMKMVDRIMALRSYTSAGPQSPCTYVHRRSSYPDIVVCHLLQDRGRIGVKEIRTLVEEFSQHAHIFFVSNVPLTLYAERELHANSGMYAEHWLTAELIQDPTKHRYYCPHRIVSKHRRRQLTTSTLPRIHQKDIICRFLGARRGNVLEIVRNHPNGFHYVIMRVVV